jgi:hypothetical protein
MRNILILSLACLMVAACGNTRGERALSGAGVGAGVGALGSAVVGGSVAGGALVGAGVGAVTGAVTDKDQVNLDR